MILASSSTPYVVNVVVEVVDEDGSKRTDIAEIPIIAWDDDGEAMVVPPHGSALIQARKLDGFQGLCRRDSGNRWDVVGVLPGGGWTTRFADDDGSLREEPVLGWTVHRDGSVRLVAQPNMSFPLSHPDQSSVTA